MMQTTRPANGNEIPTGAAARKRLWLIALASMLGGIALGAGCSMVLKQLLI